MVYDTGNSRGVAEMVSNWLDVFKHSSCSQDLKAPGSWNSININIKEYVCCALPCIISRLCAFDFAELVVSMCVFAVFLQCF